MPIVQLPHLADRVAGTHYVEGMTEAQAARAARLEVPVLVAVLLTVPVLVLLSLRLDGPAGVAVQVANWVLWSVFVLEIVVMLRIAPDDAAWLRHNKLDLAIVVLTPPFLPDALQALWVLRLLRILDVMPVVGRMFAITGFRYAATLAFIAAVGGGLAFAEIEGTVNGFDGVYWAVTTMTGTGYGDITPKTEVGKLLAQAVMLTVPALLAIVSASVGQLFERRIHEQARDAAGEVSDRLEAADRAQQEELNRQLAALAAEVGRLHERLDAGAMTTTTPRTAP